MRADRHSGRSQLAQLVNIQEAPAPFGRQCAWAIVRAQKRHPFHACSYIQPRTSTDRVPPPFLKISGRLCQELTGFVELIGSASTSSAQQVVKILIPEHPWRLMA